MKSRTQFLDASQDQYTQALTLLQDPLYSLKRNESPIISSIISKTELFQKIIETPAQLHDFLSTVHRQCSYEVFTRGTVLLKEKEDADRLYIILKGTVEKMGQRSVKDIEQEVSNIQETLDESREEERSEADTLGHTKPIFKRGSTKNGLCRFTSLKKLTIKAGLDIPKESIFSPPKSASKVENKRSNTRSISIVPISEYESAAKTGGEPQIYVSSDSPSLGSSKITSILISGSPRKDEPSSPLGRFMLGSRHFPSRSFVQSQFSSISEYTTKTENNETKPDEIDSKDERPSVAITEVLSKEHIEFVKLIASKHPEIQNRCLMKNIVKLTTTKTFKSGDHFGENFYKERQHKEMTMTAVSSDELHCLTLTKGGYYSVLEEVNRLARGRIQTLKSVFTTLTHDEVCKFSYYFSQRNLKKGDVIYTQNDLTKGLYLLSAGDVRLLREIDGMSKSTATSPAKLSKKVEIPIVSIVKNQLFGEELLLNHKSRRDTAVVNSSDATIYILDISSYNEIEESFQGFFKYLRKQAKGKLHWREERINELIEKQNSQCNTPRASLRPTQSEAKTLSTSPKLHTIMGNFGDMSQYLNVDDDNDFELKSKKSEPFGSPKKITNSGSSVVLKTLETYKSKFSRLHTNFGNTELNDWIKSRDCSPSNDLVEFNIRKELQTEVHKRRKLPTIALTCAPSPKNKKSPEEPSFNPIALKKALSSSNGVKKKKQFDFKNVSILIGSSPKLYDNFMR